MSDTRFEKVPTELDFPSEEQGIRSFWKEARIFEKSLEQTRSGPPFVFYEGPPTANGLPHNGHVLTRVIKDLFPRYKTMRGYHVARKAGWDTHGLPVEVEVEKELRIHGKAAIEEYGVEPFAKKCIESVFRYTREWEELTERVAFWVDLPTAYVTYHRSYVESVWWALSELFKKGLLYKGHKVVWWWAQGGTALSAGEVGQGYRDVDDPSVFVAFPFADEPDVAMCVWTTTPWTLPSNMYAAVNPKFEYAVVRGDPDKVKAAGAKAALARKLVVAKDLVEALGKKLGTTLTVERVVSASELVDRAYLPPFTLYGERAAEVKTKDGKTVPKLWRVLAADFVTLDAGTGIVHIASAFGEDDHNAHRAELRRFDDAVADEMGLLCAIETDGTFVKDFGKYAGRWVKDCDKELSEELRERGLLVHAETYRHPYPFCWRADTDPLIQLARPAWYVRTTKEISKAIENNQTVQWLPDHIKTGRFGDFLANNVDWALSRERFWGTPLNVWVNDETGNMEAPASCAEILAKNPRAFDHFEAAKKADPTLSEHLAVHKPWIDAVTWQNPGEPGTYRRVPEVIDCWFDSGCMPFAQWGFPHQGHDDFKKSFPADFISEAIDQTRGWFYSLLMISTLVFDEEVQARYGLVPKREYPLPFKTCIVLGHVSDKEGKKESKSKGNYTPPGIILDRVEMEFAVFAEAKGVAPVEGVAFVAKEDLEGMDLRDGAQVLVRQARDHDRVGDAPSAGRELTLKTAKGLPRRVVVLHEADRTALSLQVSSVPDVKPAEVPRLPRLERCSIEDPATPAPGADAFRWFFFASNPPWSNTRHSLTNVRTLQKDTLLKLRNVYSFFTIYANIDGFDPTKPASDVSSRPEIDRWITGELALTVEATTAMLDAYDVHGATTKLSSFVDALSNWYVRRSRERFWRSGWDDDKRAAYETLYHCLVTLSGLMAPFTPYAAESMYKNLVVRGRGGTGVAESVHLAPWPSADVSSVDRELSKNVDTVRQIVSLALQVRTAAKIKVRQPLASAKIVLSDARLAPALEAYADMMKDELNVLDVSFVTSGSEQYVTYAIKPNFRTLGQRGLGKQAQELKKHMATMGAADAHAAVSTLLSSGTLTSAGVELSADDVEVSCEAHEGFAAAGDRVGVVVLDTRLTDELRDLGFVRELLNRVQAARKDMKLEFSDRIRLGIKGGERTVRLARAHASRISGDVLATELLVDEMPQGATVRDVDVEGESVTLGVLRA